MRSLRLALRQRSMQSPSNKRHSPLERQFPFSRLKKKNQKKKNRANSVKANGEKEKETPKKKRKKKEEEEEDISRSQKSDLKQKGTQSFLSFSFRGEERGETGSAGNVSSLQQTRQKLSVSTSPHTHTSATAHVFNESWP